MSKITVSSYIAWAIIIFLLLVCPINGEEETVADLNRKCNNNRKVPDLNRKCNNNRKVNIIEACKYGSKTYYPYDEKSFTVKWNGEYPGLSGCKTSFHGLGIEGASYRVCIKVNSFYLQGPGIYLNFDAGSPPNITEESYSEYDDPEEFCGGKDEVVNVEIEADRIGGRIHDTSRSYFSLKVTAILISGESYTFEFPWQLILAFVCFIILCPFGVIARVIKRRRSEAQSQADPGVVLTRRGSTENFYSALSTSTVQVQDTDVSSRYEPISGATNVHNGTTELSLEHPTKNPSQFSFPITVNGKNQETPDRQEHAACMTPTAPPLQPFTSQDFTPEMPPPSYSDVMKNN